MADLKKVVLKEYSDRIIKFVPSDEINGCSEIIPDQKTKVVVHEKTYRGESIYDPGLEDSVKVRNITAADVAAILANNGECFVQVNHNGELRMPSNGSGRKMLVIHLTKEVVTEGLAS
ncbi:MAG: hypothetical protein ABIO57_01965 [Candidatus Paceibacterota bacterium]